MDPTPEDGLYEFWPDEPEEAQQQDQPGKPNGAADAELPEPEPLVTSLEIGEPYPIRALPRILRDAINEYHAYGQQPLPLIANAALANASLAAQGLADVARDEHLVGPISLYFLDIAVSGERKTSVDNWYKRAAREWMIARRIEMQPEVDQSTAEIAAWKAAREGLLIKLKSASGKRGTQDKGKCQNVADLRQDLIELEHSKPNPVVVPRLFYEDTNNPALAADLASDWPSASLWSDEAGLIVGGHGMSDEMAMGFIGLLNRLWDGNPFDRDRASARRAHMRGRRFTVSLMAQPVVMARLLSLAGGASRGMGLIARFLIAWPTSTIGTRTYRRAEGPMEAIKLLHARLKELLSMPLPLDPENPESIALAPPVLQLTDRASRIWQHFHNDIEAELGKKGEYADVADIGAKVAENAARLAGNFHVLTHGPVGEIDSKEMFCATHVAHWHLHEARRILAAFDKPLAISDAEILLEWLLKQPGDAVNPREILRLGPSALGRDRKRRDEAIAVLVDRRYLLPHLATMNSGKRYKLNPRARSVS